MGSRKMRRSDLYELVVARLPKIVFQEYDRKDVCIPAAYHCREILRAKGIPARLASMNVVAMNRVFNDWWQSHDGSPMPPDAWGVGIGTHNKDGEGYVSHLVVVSKGTILDCSAGQMSRPQHNMSIPDGLLCKPGFLFSDGESSLIKYEPSDEAVPAIWRLDPRATKRTRERIKEEILCDL